MIKKILRKSRLLQVLVLIGSISMYVPLLMNEMISKREFAIIMVTVLMATIYVEYHRRKMFVEFKRETSRKLKEQADRFHDGLWDMIFSKGWRIEDHYALLDLDGEFIEIHPSPKYSRTNPRYINKNKQEVIQ